MKSISGFLIIAFLITTFIPLSSMAANSKITSKLRFKETAPKDLKLTITRKSDIYETSWDRKRRHTLFEGKNTSRYEIIKIKNKKLAIHSQLLRTHKSVDGKEFSSGAPKEKSVSIYRMNSLGQRIDNSPDKKHEKKQSSELTLQFPDHKVSAGDRWEVTAPASKNYPIPVKMHFVIKEFIKKGTSLFCIINNKFESAKFFPDRNCRVKVESKNRIIFNVTKGRIVRQTGSSTYITTWAKKGAENPMQSSTFTKIKLSIR